MLILQHVPIFGGNAWPGNIAEDLKIVLFSAGNTTCVGSGFHELNCRHRHTISQDRNLLTFPHLLHVILHRPFELQDVGFF